MPREIEVKSVLNKTKRRDPWFLDDYTFNPYSSCSFNCLYCYIRGSKYGENLADSLSVKTNAITILEKQLASRAKRNQYGIIVLSSATDPYLKIESKYKLTRQALQLILKYRFPVHIITKSDLITRDFDLLKEIDSQAILPKDLAGLQCGTLITFSFSTIQDEVARVFEPGATSPSKRLKALKATREKNFLTGVNLMPLIPYISDTTEQLDMAFSMFREYKVDYIFPATLSLYGNQKHHSKTLMLNAIKKHYPHLLGKYERFFLQSNEMPDYYKSAFSKKMIELKEQHGIANTIMEASINR